METIADMMVEKLIERGMLQPSGKEVMNTSEVARYLGVRQGWIRRLVSNGDIPHYKNSASSRNFFKKSEIDEWRAARRVRTNSELQKEAEARPSLIR